MNIKTCLCAFCLQSSLAIADVIGLDDHAYSSQYENRMGGGDRFDELREMIESMGHFHFPVDQFDETQLSGVDTLFLQQPSAEHLVWSDEEIAFIQRRVSEGMNLVVVAEGGFLNDRTTGDLNRLIAPYGVRYWTWIDEGSPTIGPFHPHSITEDMTEIEVLYYRPIFHIAPPAIDLTVSDEQRDQVLAVADGVNGSGTVVFVSDSSFWSDTDEGNFVDLGDADNRLLLQNIIAHLTACESDLNGDQVADADDFFYYLDLVANGDPQADIDGDGDIDAEDFFLFLDVFSLGC